MPTNRTKSSARKNTPDAIKLLKQDHDEVRALFEKFDAAGERAHKPAARNVMDDDDIVLESLEEHHVVKWVLEELDGMDPTDDRFDAKVTVPKELVLHRAKEEERDMFPKIRKALTPADRGRDLVRDMMGKGEGKSA
jgi:hypothetical protein